MGFDFPKFNATAHSSKAYTAKVVDNQVDTLPTARKAEIMAKREVQLFLKKEKANEVLTALPKKNHSLHIVSNGSFDYFNLLPICIELLGGSIEELTFSTWTMNHINVKLLLKMFDDGKVLKINALTGEYFKAREAAVYADLLNGLVIRKQRIFTNKNHAKVTCMRAGKTRICIEGSANFTANPRIEQFAVINSPELYDFHYAWMHDVLKLSGDSDES